eukprot:ANDGO_06837.mRNA.1 Putative ankyrin repeat protein PA3287
MERLAEMLQSTEFSSSDLASMRKHIQHETEFGSLSRIPTNPDDGMNTIFERLRKLGAQNTSPQVSGGLFESNVSRPTRLPSVTAKRPVDVDDHLSTASSELSDPREAFPPKTAPATAVHTPASISESKKHTEASGNDCRRLDSLVAAVIQPPVHTPSAAALEAVAKPSDREAASCAPVSSSNSVLSAALAQGTKGTAPSAGNRTHSPQPAGHSEISLLTSVTTGTTASSDSSASHPSSPSLHFINRKPKRLVSGGEFIDDSPPSTDVKSSETTAPGSHISSGASVSHSGDAPEESADSALQPRHEGSQLSEDAKEKVKRVFSKARHNKPLEVEELLDQGVNVDVRDAFGNTLMIIAAQNGHKPVMKALLKRSCDPNAQNNKGQTPLHFCFAYGYTDLGEWLISKGARDDIRNMYGLTCYEGLGPR